MTLSRREFQAMEFLVRQKAARTFVEETLHINTGDEPLNVLPLCFS